MDRKDGIVTNRVCLASIAVVVFLVMEVGMLRQLVCAWSLFVILYC